MKFLLPFLLFISIKGDAQIDSVLENSRLVKLMMQPGSFIKLSIDTIGTNSDLHIGLLTAHDLNKNIKQRSICFTAASNFNSIYFSNTSTQIDIEDLDEFIMALGKMKETVDLKATGDFLSFQYTSSNLTVLNMENRINNKNRWDISLYKRYKYFNAAVAGSNLIIRDRFLNEVISILTNFRNTLGNDLYKEL